MKVERIRNSEVCKGCTNPNLKDCSACPVFVTGLLDRIDQLEDTVEKLLTTVSKLTVNEVNSRPDNNKLTTDNEEPSYMKNLVEISGEYNMTPKNKKPYYPVVTDYRQTNSESMSDKYKEKVEKNLNNPLPKRDPVMDRGKYRDRSDVTSIMCRAKEMKGKINKLILPLVINIMGKENRYTLNTAFCMVKLYIKEVDGYDVDYDKKVRKSKYSAIDMIATYKFDEAMSAIDTMATSSEIFRIYYNAAIKYTKSRVSAGYDNKKLKDVVEK
jgi:mRNA-degrading endonuclease HigB of HigAB toxin-antitoxin module